MPVKLVSRLLGYFDKGIVEEELKNVIAKFNLRGRIIDYGCGQMPYKPMFVNSEVVGADIEDPTMQSVATIRIKDYKTSLPKSSFDVALCTEVLEHVKEPSEVLKELNHLLKPNGYLVLTAPFMIPEHDERDYWRFTIKGLKLLAKENGFEAIYEKKLTNNMHSISHMLRNVIAKSWINEKSRSKYVTSIVAIPVIVVVGALFGLLKRLSSLRTGPMICMIVCRKA
ncbi:MAG: class I SAM-dependent methyltransferase [Candidatus Aenigmatarchaeota archaeon]